MRKSQNFFEILIKNINLQLYISINTPIQNLHQLMR
jgi:hypothetical protein